MATVTLDCSEYDMLRENKADAEKKVRELTKELEENKKNMRVIVTTKHCAVGFDKEAFEHAFCVAFNSRSPITGALEQAMIASRKYMDLAGYQYDSVISSSNQLVNFDDVRVQVENTFRKEYEAEIDNKKKELEASKEQYNEKYVTLEKTYLEGHRNEILNIEKNHEDIIDSLQSTIKELQRINQELGKSTEQQIEEAKAIIEEQKEKLSKLSRKKKFLFW